MTASRRPGRAGVRAPGTACPPRRSFVAVRRPPPGTGLRGRTRTKTPACGAVLPTPAMLAGMDNARRPTAPAIR